MVSRISSISLIIFQTHDSTHHFLTSYLELSELSRKLLGFMHVQQQASMAAAASQPPTASSSSSTSKTSSAPADAARAAARGDAAAGAQSESASAHVSPLALVHRFLMSLMHPDKDGRVNCGRNFCFGSSYEISLERFFILFADIHSFLLKNFVRSKSMHVRTRIHADLYFKV